MKGRNESLQIKSNMKTEQIITDGQYSYFDSNTVYNNFRIVKNWIIDPTYDDVKNFLWFWCSYGDDIVSVF